MTTHTEPGDGPAWPAAVNLADPGTHAARDLTGHYAELRRSQPLGWHPPPRSGAPGFWVLSRHEDVSTLCRDPARFGSSRGNVLDTLLAGGDSAGGRMLAVTDGERHTALRRILREPFTPEALAEIQRRIAAAAMNLVAQAVARGECDFAKDVAAGIPLNAICDLLGVAEEDRDFVLRCTSAALGSEDPEGTAADARRAQGELLMHFAKITRARRAEPRADLITLLARGTDTVRPTDDEAMLNCYSLILGGDETTRLAIIGAVQALIEHPDQWRALKAGDVSTAAATEEVLRWTVPAMHVGRTAMRDTRLHGRLIKAGDVVTGWLISANFDEEVFAAPGEFDLSRSPNRHLSFSHGPHFCLGLHLARIEISALLEALRTHVDRIEPTGTPQPIYSTFLHGYSSLPVHLYG